MVESTTTSTTRSCRSGGMSRSSRLFGSEMMTLMSAMLASGSSRASVACALLKKTALAMPRKIVGPPSCAKARHPVLNPTLTGILALTEATAKGELGGRAGPDPSLSRAWSPEMFASVFPTS